MNRGALIGAAIRSFLVEVIGYVPARAAPLVAPPRPTGAAYPERPDRAACPPGGMKGGDADSPPAAFPPASLVSRAPLGEVASGPLWSVMQVGRKTLLMGPGVTLTLDAASADMIARQLTIAGTMQGRVL